jgi:trigger factor
MRLIDMEIGKEQEFSVQVPDDAPAYQQPGAAGSVFVTIQEIKEKVLPDVDDAFATLFATDTVDALKQKVRDAHQAQREEAARGRLENKILDAVAEVSTVQMPDAMVDRQVDRMYRDREEYFRQQGFGMDLYLRATQSTEAQMRQELRPQAEKRLRNYLLVEELGRVEGTVVEDTAVQAEIERVAALQRDPDAARKQLSTNEVHEDVRNQLQVKLLFDRLIALVTEGQAPVPYAPPSPDMPAAADAADAEEPVLAPPEPEKPKLIIATH